MSVHARSHARYMYVFASISQSVVGTLLLDTLAFRFSRGQYVYSSYVHIAAGRTLDVDIITHITM